MPLAQALPKPKSASLSRSKWDDDEDDEMPDVKGKAVQTKIWPPPYGQRQGFIPKAQNDYGDGGAFPEIHVAQYPLDMGRKAAGGGGGSSSTTLALQTDADGNLRYDLVLKQGARANKVIHSALKDMQEKDVQSENDLARPDDEAIKEATDKTRAALEKLVDARIKAAQPKSITGNASGPVYVKYTPAQQGTVATKSRIIRMMEAPVDPMEPPKFKHKKIPRGPPSPPVPVLRSPPRKVTAEEQKNWVIPPCISNWKNAKGYTIPLDKRLAADGRGIQDIQINDNFAKLGEALAIADRHVREEVRVRGEMEAKLLAKEKEDKERKLRELAQQARDQRAGIAPARHTAAAGGPGGGIVPTVESDDDSDDSEDSDLAAKAKERDELRRERNQQRIRETRMQNMGADAKAKATKLYVMRWADRDISEKIALGLAQPTVSKDSMLDQRLFNQSAGISSGFADNDAYDLYDKPLFTGSSANAIYKFKKGE
ncbi:SNW domain-containing protein 1, partial [Irineochytrium annulatum]